MEVKDKISFSGTHPDSLYRVNLNGGDPGSGLLARCYRLLRWPAALLATCVALALFIYYVMPDSAESELLGSNATVWEAGLAGKFRHRPAQQRRPSDDDYYRQPVDPDTTTDYPADSDDSNTTEIDFLGAAIQKNFQEILQEEIEDANIQNMAHPVYPEHVTPEVQYGNERSYPGTARVPKVFEPKMSTTEFTLRTPYRDSKGDLALYVNEDVSTEATQETTNYKLKPTTDGPVRYSLPHGMKANFTSGHSKLFGISIEDAERYQTTPNSLYNTRVSPTLPAMAGHYNKFSLSTTTRRSDIDDVFSCRSISLDACRRVLRYDLTAGPVLPLTINDTELEKLTQEFHEIMESPCSRRLDQFLCNLMQTECTSSGMTVKKPCKKLCKAVLNDCKNIPSPNSLLSRLFDCSLYPEDNCIDLKEPCMDDEMSCQDGTCFHVSKKCNDVKECANGYDESECSGCSSSQYRCAQSGCIPKRWLCDGYADCPNGEDEEDCRAEKEGFFPHPRQYPSANPSKPPKLPGWISKPLKGVLDARHDILREGAESVISPQVQLPKNALQKPTKVDKTRVNDASRKGEYDNRELLMMSDSTNRAPPVFKAYGNKPVAEPVDKLVPAMAHAVGDILDNLEKMADADKWWEQNPDDEMLDGEFVNSQIASERRSGTAHASPCPVGELRCVDGRCIMFSQLCDGHVDCSDHADEDNCSV